MSFFSPRFPGPILAFLRFATGTMLVVFHGWGKVNAAYAHLIQGSEWGFMRLVENLGFSLPGFFALAATFAEFFGGILLAIGLFTRQAALAIAITMTVATYRHLTGDMRFELAALYLVLSLVFFLGPSTPFSVDGTIGKRDAGS
jgi:putative oxidoreductase